MKKRAPKSIRLPIEVKAFGVRSGYPVSVKTANRVGPLMLSLMKQGKYSPAALVDAARDPDCPAHGDFEWDDDIAAEKWRVEQARVYQRAIVYDVIVESGGEKKTIEMRVVHPIGYSQKTRYATGRQVLLEEGLAAHVLERAEAALDSWRDTYSSLRSAMRLSGVFEAIDEVLGPRKPPVPRKRRRRR